MTARHKLPSARHVVCFWKQSDLGLFGRRPDRWITAWEQDPSVEKVLVFEAPADARMLSKWLQLSLGTDPVHATEFNLLLRQWMAKHAGEYNSEKVSYHAYVGPEGEAAQGAGYLRWVLQQVKAAGITGPLVMLWPACFVNPALLQAMAPSQVVVDLVDDQRLFPGNEAQVPAMTAQYRTLTGLADVVLSNSAGLIRQFEDEFSCRITHLPNDRLPMMEPLHDANPNVLAAAQRLKTAPVAGYVGNMRGRMDVQTLVSAIAANPQWLFWFVGQTHGSEFYRAAHHLSNCRFWGTLRQADANAVMAQFDVGLIPFKPDALVNSMSPIKANSYSKLKLPVVSLLEIAPADFGAALKKVLSPKTAKPRAAKRSKTPATPGPG